MWEERGNGGWWILSNRGNGIEVEPNKAAMWKVRVKVGMEMQGDGGRREKIQLSLGIGEHWINVSTKYLICTY